MNFFDQFKKEHLIIAHRGLRSLEAENTLEAFELSNNRCDMFEFDIQYTKDRVAVVIHDDTLLRTTNIKDIKKFKNRYPYYVRDFTFKELSVLNNRSWFYKDDPFGSIKDGKIKSLPLSGHISKLDDILSFSLKGKYKINLEIKDSFNCSTEFIANDISKKIKEFNFQESCIISSFNHNYIFKIKNIEPNLHTAAIFAENRMYNLIDYLKMLKVDAYHINPHLADKKSIEQINKANIYTNVYTINDKTKANELFNIGVKAIFSDTLEFNSFI